MKYKAKYYIVLSVFAGIYAISMLACARSFLPGGLGSTEIAMGGLLVLIGTEPTAAMGSTIVCRVATLWFAVVLGLAVLGGHELMGARVRNACSG